MKNLTLLAASALFITLFVFMFNARSQEPKAPYEVATACAPYDISGTFDTTGTLAVFNNEPVDIPENLLAIEEPDPNVLGIASEERWIEVDLSDQKLIAWEGDTKFVETAISSGLRWTVTPIGEFRIWIKLRATKMEGGQGAYYYYLPNVPYVMFFENEEVPGWKGYGLHGTYWHNDFGTPRSHGCVNLPTDMAKVLYEWTSPVIPEGKWMVRSSEDNPGTRIVIHE